MISIYDSTLRDGGYINNWNFTPQKIQAVYNACNDGGIDYVEIGYFDKVNPEKLNKSNSMVMVMIDYNKRDKYDIPDRENSKVDGIRVATHKPEIDDAIEYAKLLKEKGYLIAIQMMAITNYEYEELGEIAKRMDGLDIVSLADSNGSLMPNDIGMMVTPFKGYKYAINFHPHNNLQLAFANSITTINNGIDMIDCSFNGIGRGAGNLPTELILSYLNKYEGYEFNLEPILNAIDKYILPFRGAYQWGYNIPNMFSGLEKIHPYYGRDSSKYNLSKTQKAIKKIGVDKPMKYYGKKKILCVIPARYESSRFLGKPLELICGKSLIKHVYDNAMKVKLFDEVIVATDDGRISTFCDENDINYTMTRKDCKTGTDRIAEVAGVIDADLYINVQGDEPLLTPNTIEKFIKEIFDYGELDRVAYNSMTDCSGDDITNINVPKVIVDVYGDLLYMSRLPIPHNKSGYIPKYYKELGLHAYTKRGLKWFSIHNEQFNSEKAEGLEFLRFLETGKAVRMIYLDLPYNNHAVDVKEDIKIVEEIMNETKKMGLL